MPNLHFIFRVFLISTYFVLLVYVFLPSPPFPYQPTDSVQSLEDADTEIPLRRAYFTNFSRSEVVKQYTDQFKKLNILGFSWPSYRLNYPPEDAYTIIRDQTRSTFLEEVVHPLRESAYVNGFKPKEEKDMIWYKGKQYEQKITILYKPSNLLVRILVLTLGFGALLFLIKHFFEAIQNVYREWMGLS